jgi:hypothetical protein
MSDCTEISIAISVLEGRETHYPVILAIDTREAVSTILYLLILTYTIMSLLTRAVFVCLSH